jgi:hypothetical protein
MQCVGVGNVSGSGQTPVWMSLRLEKDPDDRKIIELFARWHLAALATFREKGSQCNLNRHIVKSVASVNQAHWYQYLAMPSIFVIRAMTETTTPMPINP